MFRQQAPIFGGFSGSATVPVAPVGVPPAESPVQTTSPFGRIHEHIANRSGLPPSNVAMRILFWHLSTAQRQTAAALTCQGGIITILNSSLPAHNAPLKITR
jgi:hypothetical protein